MGPVHQDDDVASRQIRPQFSVTLQWKPQTLHIITVVHHSFWNTFWGLKDCQRFNFDWRFKQPFLFCFFTEFQNKTHTLRHLKCISADLINTPAKAYPVSLIISSQYCHSVMTVVLLCMLASSTFSSTVPGRLHKCMLMWCSLKHMLTQTPHWVDIWTCSCFFVLVGHMWHWTPLSPTPTPTPHPTLIQGDSVCCLVSQVCLADWWKRLSSLWHCLPPPVFGPWQFPVWNISVWIFNHIR